MQYQNISSIGIVLKDNVKIDDIVFKTNAMHFGRWGLPGEFLCQNNYTVFSLVGIPLVLSYMQNQNALIARNINAISSIVFRFYGKMSYALLYDSSY